jgi:hypothetical protein
MKQLSLLLKLDANRTLDDLVHLLKNARVIVSKLSKEERIAFARGLLSGLDINGVLRGRG